jgi:hypothetical protein
MSRRLMSPVPVDALRDRDLHVSDLLEAHDTRCTMRDLSDKGIDDTFVAIQRVMRL